jgi:hypothetical protein
MGDNVDWVRIGPLLVMHGNRTPKPEQDGWFHTTVIVNTDRHLSETRWLDRNRNHPAPQ